MRQLLKRPVLLLCHMNQIFQVPLMEHIHYAPTAAFVGCKVQERVRVLKALAPKIRCSDVMLWICRVVSSRVEFWFLVDLMMKVL